jgi:2,3-bisphosphoglycerate-independent phosphoglycerate mutase
MFTKDHIISEAVRLRYREGEEDEGLSPLVRFDGQGIRIGGVRPGDSVIFYDLRGEREVELSLAMVSPEFAHFKISGPVAMTTMIEYHPDLKVKVAFPPEFRLKNTLSEVISASGARQLKIGESEKAVHLGYFLNGKTTERFAGEEMVIVESPKVDDYSRVPELMAGQVADEVIKRLGENNCRFIAVNFANVDVIGHLENEPAIIRAIECVDAQIGRVTDAALRLGVPAIISADHGTVEKWLYPDGAIDTGHTDSPVPMVLADNALRDMGVALESGELSDLAPTILHLLGLKIPAEMTGKSLVRGAAGKSEKVLLIIADGWGFREEKFGNLILKAKTPNMDRLWSNYPHAALKASGLAVGMPEGAVGNSEAGHLHIGAGRRIYSDRVKIDRAIEDKTFFKNPVLLDAVREAVVKKAPLHLLGIVSFYSSHGSLSHLYALLELAKAQGAQEVHLHSLLGRRGERPESGAHYIKEVEDYCAKVGLGKVVTVMGRFWALDREQNWDRVEKAYRAMFSGQGIAVEE